MRSKNMITAIIGAMFVWVIFLSGCSQPTGGNSIADDPITGVMTVETGQKIFSFIEEGGGITITKFKSVSALNDFLNQPGRSVEDNTWKTLIINKIGDLFIKKIAEDTFVPDIIDGEDDFSISGVNCIKICSPLFDFAESAAAFIKSSFSATIDIAEDIYDVSTDKIADFFELLLESPQFIRYNYPTTNYQLSGNTKPLTLSDIAFFAKDCYEHNTNDSNFKSFLSGFKAAKYEVGDYVVVAYAGTSIIDIRDVITDLNMIFKPQAVNAISKYTKGFGFPIITQINEAGKFLQDSIRGENGKKIIITGHSLGGFLAQIVGYGSGVETHTFNAPGASAYATHIYGLKNSLNITNHRGTKMPNGTILIGEYIGGTNDYSELGGVHDDFLLGHSIDLFYNYLLNNTHSIKYAIGRAASGTPPAYKPDFSYNGTVLIWPEKGTKITLPAQGDMVGPEGEYFIGWKANFVDKDDNVIGEDDNIYIEGDIYTLQNNVRFTAQWRQIDKGTVQITNESNMILKSLMLVGYVNGFVVYLSEAYYSLNLQPGESHVYTDIRVNTDLQLRTATAASIDELGNDYQSSVFQLAPEQTLNVIFNGIDFVIRN